MAQKSEQHYSNAQEADSRIWRHAEILSPGTNLLIYSPDTDVYNIGLSNFNSQNQPPKNYIIQLNVHHSTEKRYLFLNNLQTAFLNDPDLSTLSTNKIGLTIQSLFISTGCDFISYFKLYGKATILNCFFQYASFICGNTMTGSLEQTMQCNKDKGFLSFLRLVGTCYFKKHLAAFIANYNYSTPIQLYNSLEQSLSTPDKHKLWIQQIRRTVANRITNEEERVPSITSLWRHWTRSCWISQMWQNSHLPDMYSPLPQPESCGWLHSDDGGYHIDWEAPEIIERVKNTIEFLTKGCTCKKGCRTNNCGCKKKYRYCGPGCECQGCTNVPSVDQTVGSELSDDNNSGEDSSEKDYSEYDECTDNELEQEIITEDFPFDDNLDII